MESGALSLLYSLKQRHYFHSNPAFTIVELLIVIVIIGILASITLVTYSGAQQKATAALLTSDLANASKQLKMFQVENSNYPTTIDCVQPDSTTNKCLKPSDNTVYSYFVDNNATSQTFCVTATKSSYSYSINNNGLTIPASYCPILYLDAGSTSSYPGVGTTWKDLSGNGNNATLAGGVGYDADSGGSLTFDGVNDSAIVNNLNSNITTSFTVSAWMKFDKYAYMQPLMMHETVAFKWRVSGQNTYWNIYNNTSYDNSIAYLSAPSINEWHYYTFTYDGLIEKIYLDGVVQKQFTKSILISSPTSLDIAPSSGEVVDGSISSVSVYNRALSVSEISQNFNALRGRYGI